MNDADELAKLADLHARGVLNDEEFAKAKARVLSGQGSPAGAYAGSSTSPNVGAVNGLRRSRMDRCCLILSIGGHPSTQTGAPRPQEMTLLRKMPWLRCHCGNDVSRTD